MIKKIGKYILVLSLILGIYLGVKLIHKKEYKPNMYVAIGDGLLLNDPSYASLVYEKLKNKKLVKGYSDLIKRSSLDSSSLLRFLEVDANIIDENESSKVSSLIKKAKYLTLQVGEEDLKTNLRFNKSEEKFYYSSEVINRTMSNLQENLYNILNEIKQINPKVKIYVLGYYFPYPYLDDNKKVAALEIYGLLNQAISMACNDSYGTFINISDVSNVEYFDNNNLNEKGQEIIAEEILRHV